MHLTYAALLKTSTTSGPFVTPRRISIFLGTAYLTQSPVPGGVGQGPRHPNPNSVQPGLGSG